MALNIYFLLGALYILPGQYAIAQSTTILLPPQGDTGSSWIVDDAQAFASSQTMSIPESTQNLDMTHKSLTIHLKVPKPTLAPGPGTGELATTVPILGPQTELPSNASVIEASETASSSLSRPFLPAVTVAEFNPSEATTDTQSSASKLSTSILTIEQQATTVYVAAFTPTTSQTLEPVPTESESFLESSGITTPGSKANIAAIGLGAGCGVLVLVVVLAMTVWLLRRHRRSSRRADRQDVDVKLERQSY